MSDDSVMNEFEFGGEPVNREPDPFADLDEFEFNQVLEMMQRIKEVQGIEGTREAGLKAKELWNESRVVIEVTQRGGGRVHGSEKYPELVREALIQGKKPCEHGHIEGLTFCGQCFKAKHANAKQRVKVLPPCDHTRLDFSVPCPACMAEFDGAGATEVDILQAKIEFAKKSPTKGSLTAALHPIGHELSASETNALVGILLDRLGGEVKLTPDEMEQISSMAQAGLSAFEVEPDGASFQVDVRRINPLAWVRKVSRPNPSVAPVIPGFDPHGWAEEDDDLPF